jgi:DNA-binding NtrC family response regulator
LRAVVRNALEKQSLRLENRWLHEQLKTIQGSGNIIGKSVAMRKVMDLHDRRPPDCRRLSFGFAI